MSFDVEGALLAAVMADNSAFWKVADLIGEDDFADGRSRKLWVAVSSLIRNDSAADALTVGDRFPALGDVALQVAQGPGTVRNVRAYAEAIASQAVARRLVSAGNRIARLSGPDAYAEAMRLLAACAPRSQAHAVTLSAAMRSWFDGIAKRADHDLEMTGLPTSLPWLDEQTGGLQPGDLVCLAARPSVGKTTLGMQFALHAGEAGKRVAVFSAEMSATQLADRAVSSLGEVSTHVLRRPKSMTDDDWNRVTAGLVRGKGLPIVIDDSNGMTGLDIAARSRQLHADEPLSMVVIDYLQILRHPKADRHDIAIGETTRTLKELAKELRVPVAILCQLNRDADNARPTMRMLKDSGSIEQDADLIMFLHRPNPKQWGCIELILEKQRNGPTGSDWLYGDFARMWFRPGTAPEETDEPVSRGFGGPRRARPVPVDAKAKAAGA